MASTVGLESTLEIQILLSGHLFHAATVRETLETLRSATGNTFQPSSASTDPATPAAASAKRPRHEAAVEEEAVVERVRGEGSSNQVAGATGEEKTAAAAVSAREQSWRDRQQKKKKQEQLNLKQQGRVAGVTKGKKKKRGVEREFDHSRWRRRTVAVQLMYEGGGYAGFCSQAGDDHA